MTIATVGLDIAKQIFQVHGVDRSGKVVLRKRLRRGEVARFFAGVEPCLIGLEASGGAHYWFRILSRSGHTGRLIAPQFVKPYVKSQKERCQRRGSNLRSGKPPEYAIRSGQVGRPARSAVPPPCALPVHRVPHTARQPDTRAAGRVRDCSPTARRSATAPSSATVGR